MFDKLRGTGRTDRMLFDAVNTGIGKRRFRKVIILCDNPCHIKSTINEWFSPQIVRRIEVVKFELKTYHTIGNDVGYKAMICRGKGWDVDQVYIDHFVFQKYRESFVPPNLVLAETKYA